MYCRFCGEQVPNDTRFCPNCYNPCGFEDISTNSNNVSAYKPKVFRGKPVVQKVCKYCRSHIDKNAKVCPVCRKSQKVKVFRYLVLIFLLYAVIGGYGGEYFYNSDVKDMSDVIILGGYSDASGNVYTYMNGDNSEFREGLRQADGSTLNFLYRLPAGQYIISEISANDCGIYKKGGNVHNDLGLDDFNIQDLGGLYMSGSLLSDTSISDTWALYTIISPEFWYSHSTYYTLDVPITVNNSDLLFVSGGYLKLDKVN